MALINLLTTQVDLGNGLVPLPIPNHPTYTQFTRRVNRAGLSADPITHNIQIMYMIDTMSNNNPMIPLEHSYRLSALWEGGQIRRNMLGEKIVKYQSPENSVLKYEKKGIIKPFLNGEFVDWLKDENGELVENPNWNTAIEEAKFFSILCDNDQIPSIKTYIINTWLEAYQMGRFEFLD